MFDEHLRRIRALTILRQMLRGLILEAHVVEASEPERAAHLHDAVSDLRLLIRRLQREARASALIPSAARRQTALPDAEAAADRCGGAETGYCAVTAAAAPAGVFGDLC